MKLVAWQVNEIIQSISKMNYCFKKIISIIHFMERKGPPENSEDPVSRIRMHIGTHPCERLNKKASLI